MPESSSPPRSLPENPYAAPAMDDPSVPEESRHPWWVQGGDLLVRHNGKLPRVDLQSGKNDAELLPCTLVVVAMPSLTLSKSSAPRNTQIHCYVSRERALKRGNRRYAWIGIIASRIGIVVMITGMFTQRIPMMSLGLVLILPGYFTAGLWTRSVLRSVPLRKNWIRFPNIPSAALARLETLQREPLPADPAVVRVISSHSYLQRYPLSTIVTRRWLDPIFALQRLLNRLIAPKAWEFESIHPRHRLVFDPAALPPRLSEAIERWRKLQPDFASWTMTEAFRIPSLAHFVLAEYIQLSSPDGNHSVVIVLPTVTVNGIANETFSLYYATLLTGGLWVFTNTRRIVPDLSPSVQAAHSSGNHAQAWPRHLAAVGSQPVVPATSAAEWIERRLALDELFQRGLEARGLADLPREIEVPETILTGA